MINVVQVDIPIPGKVEVERGVPRQPSEQVAYTYYCSCLAEGWSDEIIAFVWRFSHLTSGWASRHFMATNPPVNMPAMHEPWSLR